MMVSAAWFIRPGLNYLTVMSVVLLLVATLGLAISGRPAGILISERNLMSLSAFQMMLWTIIIGSAYLTMAVARVRAGLSVDAQSIGFDEKLWILMGISTASFLGTAIVQSSKMAKNPNWELIEKASRDLNEPVDQIAMRSRGMLYANIRPSDAAVSDMFTGDGLGNKAYIQFPKVQMFLFTIIAALSSIVYLFQRISATPGAPSDSPLQAFFSGVSVGLISILAISHAAFLLGTIISDGTIGQSETESVSQTHNSTLLSPQRTQPASLITRVEGAVALKDYAVSRGLNLPTETLDELNRAQAALLAQNLRGYLQKRGMHFDVAVTELSTVTYPTSIETVAAYSGKKSSRSIMWFRVALPIIAILSVGAAIGSYSSNGYNSTDDKLSRSILAAALGLLGSLVYQLFNLTGIMAEKAFKVEDIYTNIIRLVLGPVVGWIFYYAFQGTQTKESVVLLLIPFLSGFSTKFVLGALNQVIRAAELVLGIDGKSNQLALRGRLDDKRKSPPSD
jgi:hypothetical protein